jgi:WD40 repeat protein/serine/threonine protein kinase
LANTGAGLIRNGLGFRIVASNQWQEVPMTDLLSQEEAIFYAALEIDAAEQRAAYLDAACGDQGELRRRVEALLRRYAESAGPLDRPAGGPGATTAELPAERPGALIGPYKLLEPVGEGGMGAVWMAQQTEPVKRLVALKLIKAGLDSKQVIARFEAERQALALMDHPNIAKVLDGGTTSAGRPYFVMDLVKGTPITNYCDEHHFTPRQRLQLFTPVCQAVQHAHQKGVIHRDLKPSNVLVALYDGKPVPKVIDFGVAKAAGQQLTNKTLVTGFGAIVGTLEYMSPEQAEINQLDIDTRSDIYALGVLLYELLTGSPPFTRKDLEKGGVLEMLRVIREQEPAKPSTKLSTAQGLPTLAANRGTEPAKLTKLVRGELDWIVMKALEKDRNRRYETASAFAADVQRYLNDEPVQACPPSVAYRFRKFARRNKVALATMAVVAAALLTVLLVLVVSEVRVREEHQAREEALDAKVEAESQRANKEAERAQALERWRHTAYYLQIALATDAYRANNVARANEVLDLCEPDLHHWEWHYLKRLCNSELSRVAVGRPEGLLLRLRALSQDGQRVAIVGAKSDLHVYDTVTGEETLTFSIRDQHIDEVVFSPDSKRLATVGVGRQDNAYVWDAGTGERQAILMGLKTPGQSLGLWGAAFSPNGQLLASTDKRGHLFVLDVASGKEQFPPVEAHPQPNAKPGEVWSTKVAFNPDGTQLATACCEDGAVKVWEAQTGKLVRSLEQGPGFARAVFSPKGSWVAAAGKWMMVSEPYLPVWVWDLKTGKRRHVLRGHTRPVACLAFSPDETQLATGSLDGTLTVWDVATGQEVGIYRGHEREVRALAYSPDGKRVISLSSDRVVRNWDATHGPDYLVLKCRGAWHATFSPDGRRIAAACNLTGERWGVRVWDAETGQALMSLAADTVVARTVAFSPDGRHVAAAVMVGSPTGAVKVFDVGTKQLVRSLPDEAQELGAPCDAVAWSPDGKLIASGGQDRIVRVWDAATGQQLQALAGHARSVSSVIFSRDGKRLVSASGGITRRFPIEAPNPLKLPSDQPKDIPDVKVWDVATGAELHSLSFPGKGPGLALSPDGETVAVSFGETGVAIYRTVRFPGGGTVMTTVLTPPGADVVRLYDLATGKEVGVLKGHTRPPWCVAFSPDGRRIVTGGGADQMVKLWDARTGQEIMTVGQHPDIVTSVSFSPDGQKIVSTSDDGNVRVWDATPVKK